MYCFVPSYEADKGTAFAYDYIPDFMLDFQFYVEIEKVTFELYGGNNINPENLSDSNKQNKGGTHADDKSKQSGSNKSGLRVSNHGKMIKMNADIKTRNKFNGNKFNPKKRSCGNKSITASLNVGNGETNRYFCSFNKFSVLEDVEVDIEHGSDLLNDIKGASLVKNFNNKLNIRNNRKISVTKKIESHFREPKNVDLCKNAMSSSCEMCFVQPFPK